MRCSGGFVRMGWTFLSAPRLAAIERVRRVVLPDGPTLVRVSVTGWGRLAVGRERCWFWGPCVFELLVPVGVPARVAARGLFGQARSEILIPANLSEQPHPAPAPRLQRHLAAVARLPAGPAAERLRSIRPRGPRVSEVRSLTLQHLARLGPLLSLPAPPRLLVPQVQRDALTMPPRLRPGLSEDQHE
jgi:hypothetical protein